MSTNFPTSLDAPAASTSSDTLTSPTPHHTLHNNINDAIGAIEAKVGVDGSAVTTTHRTGESDSLMACLT